ALFACCAAMRLARFNAEADDDDDHSWFEGLPSPAAAAMVAGAALLCSRIRTDIRYESFQAFDWWLQRILPPVALVVSLLIVSRIPYPHAVTHTIRGQKSFPQLVAIVFALMAVWAVRWYAVPVVATAYALGPPAWYAWQWSSRRFGLGIGKVR